MDEHGQKVAQAAAERGVAPQAFVDDVAETLRRRCGRGSASRTISSSARPTPTHKRGVQRADRAHLRAQSRRLLREGVRGLVLRRLRVVQAATTRSSTASACCIRRATLRVGRGAQLVLPPERATQDFLREHFDEQPEFLQPESRRNEILALLEQGLEDISASRSRLAWGDSLPAAARAPARRRRRTSGSTRCRTTSPRRDFPTPRYDERWPAQLHVIGKDITRFHCVIWPAMLQAAELPLPERVWAHGFVLLGGERFSKSAGVRARSRRSDRPLRRRRVPLFPAARSSVRRATATSRGSDSTSATTPISRTRCGNLASRAIAMVEKYCDGVVPAGAPQRDRRRGRGGLVRYH